MKTTNRIAGVLVLLIIISACSQSDKSTKALSEKSNFLIFFIDDLRPELACYGEQNIISPNIDKIAEGGLRFDRAYCNVPVCGASRASLLSGIRPGPQRFVGYNTLAQDDLPGHVSMPEYFKNNGYYTLSYGKIYHHLNDKEESWSEKPWRAKPAFNNNWRDYVTPANVDMFETGKPHGPATEIAQNAPDSIYIDGKVANAAVRKLKELSKMDQPFMFWIGYVKPHLPFNAPSKYWDLYDRADIKPASNPHKPKNGPDQAMHNFGELRAYTDIPPNGPISEEKAIELKHGYYASVSYTDALIGQVMDELKRLELDENTIVAIFGDHGWNLGEHGLWCKHCNFHTSLQVPLIINIPGVTAGESTSGLTEFVDLYPTFADLAGLPIPEYLDGKTLIPLIMKPELKWDSPVFPRYVLGNSVVTKDMIYTEFMRSRKDCTIVANMLFDHRKDPEENINVADEAHYDAVVDSLSLQLNAVHFGD